MTGKTIHILTSLVIGAAAIGNAQVWAQHDEHGQHEPEETEFAMPTTYADAIDVIHGQLEKIDSLIDTRQLDRVHAEAAIIRDVANTLARLALDKDSGIPREAIREINLTARDLAAKFDPIDEAGDSDNLPGTEKVYGEMVALFEILKKHVPKQYLCPMGCEPGKTYNQPQACPVCGMQLKLFTNKQYSVEVSSTGGTIRAGEKTTLTFQIKDPAGGPLRDLQVVHERELHLFMVSKDLSWYVHEHPQSQTDGTFTLPFRFLHAGEFVLFHDFTPAGVGMQVVPVTLHVEGTPPPAVKLAADHDLTRVVEGYTVHLDTHGALAAGNKAVLAYEISRDGRPVSDLEPYHGAMGHLVIISEDLKQFVHSHPLGDDHQGESAHDESGDEGEHRDHGGVASGSHSSIVSFHAQFPTGGVYKSWAQFKHRGRVLTVPFVIQVGAGSDHHVDTDHDHH